MRKLFVLLLACLLVTGTASAVLAVVAINETNFPDAVFRRYISENFDANKDGILANNEILGVKQIEMVNQDNFRSLQGIKYLTSLEDLNIRYSSGFPIRELDISGLSALKNVYFYAGDYKDDHGRLTTVDASGCTALETLDFSRQSITSLNLSGCTALQVLDCQSNKLTSLDLTECTSLQTLYCYDNKLTSLNLEGCSSLRWLQCENNKLTSLNLQGCSSLCDLYCYDNAITALDLSTNTELTCIYCYNNKLESLNVKNCFNLQFLHAENNQLSALDLSDNLELSTLQCKNNHLPLLDVEDNTNMYDYSCSPQHIDGLKSTRQTNGTYTVNLRDYLADSVKNVVADSVYGTDDSKNLLESSYDSGTGIITFSAAPALVYYEYDTKYSKNDALRYMGVTLAASAAPYITTSSLPEGYIDTPYTCQLEANGETPITWTAEESLPDGLTLNSENGEISGTPATSGSYTLTITAANDFGSQTKDFTLTISGGNPTVNYETTKWEIVNGLLTVQHTGSSSALTFSPIDGTNGTGFKISGDFPANLIIHLPAEWELDVDDGAKVTVSDTSKVKEAKDVDGLESPAVKIIGDNDITLNESGITMTAWYTAGTPSAKIETTKWEIENGKLIIETNGTPSRYEFDALTSPDTNGDGFKITGLPSGLKINLPEKWGIDIDTSSSVTVSDESKIIPHTEIPGLPETAHRIMGSNTITLNASDIEMTAFLFTAPAITTKSLPEGSAGEVYKFTFEATGTGPITWTSEELPEGFALSSAGELVGISETSAKYTFTVTAENDAGKDSREFTLTIKSGKPGSLSITTKELTEATAGQEYSFQLTAEGANSFTWSAATKLPKDLSLSSEGLISGTPAAAGTYRIIVIVKSPAGISANAVLTLKVKSSSPNTKPKVKTTKLPDGFKDMEYSYQLEAEGTVDSWKLADGSTLPEGLELDTETGQISGTITESSAKTFRFKVIAVNGEVESAAKSISIKIVAQNPYFKTEDLKAATWNKSYSFMMKLANFRAVTWTIDGDLPEGIKFDKGKFSGKPQEVGEFDLTIKANNGAAEIEEDFTLRVNSIPPKLSGSFKAGTEGQYYECKLKATGSTPITWDFDYLPDGLTPIFDATGETCIISGTPTEVFSQSVAITLTNGDNEGDSITAHKKMTIKAVKPRFSTTAKDVPDGTVNENYSYQLQLKDGYIPSNVTWDYTGDMPEGLELDTQNGLIYGTPSKAVKNSRFTVFARNAAKETFYAKLIITMTINEADNESESDTRLPVVGENLAEDSKPEFVNGIAYYERGEISAEGSAILSGSGEIVAAILPAVEVETENLYEFTVSLDVNAPEGGLLVWHSFPDGHYDGSESEAYFLDGEDSVIECVPENHSVTVAAWLKPGIIYEPVIAVKISHKD